MEFEAGCGRPLKICKGPGNLLSQCLSCILYFAVLTQGHVTVTLRNADSEETTPEKTKVIWLLTSTLARPTGNSLFLALNI